MNYVEIGEEDDSDMKEFVDGVLTSDSDEETPRSRGSGKRREEGEMSGEPSSSGVIDGSGWSDSGDDSDDSEERSDSEISSSLTDST